MPADCSASVIAALGAAAGTRHELQEQVVLQLLRWDQQEHEVGQRQHLVNVQDFEEGNREEGGLGDPVLDADHAVDGRGGSFGRDGSH